MLQPSSFPSNSSLTSADKGPHLLLPSTTSQGLTYDVKGNQWYKMSDGKDSDNYDDSNYDYTHGVELKRPKAIGDLWWLDPGREGGSTDSEGIGGSS